VPDRPYVLLSAAMSVDGCIDDGSPRRLVLSGPEDADLVDAIRAGCDAILVGAGTIRRDNPSLLVRSPQRRSRRLAEGRPASPAKVTLTATGALEPGARFFADGDTTRLVYVPTRGAAAARAALGGVATVIAMDGRTARDEGLALGDVLADLAGRGVARLLVEGGSQIHTQFLAAGLADELRLAIAPFFVGDPAAPRLVGAGPLPNGPDARMTLAEVARAGDMAVLRFRLGRSSAEPETGSAQTVRPAGDPAGPGNGPGG
jgi:5-amino-6-(5-phosphoribosylamino)uracil reductase